MSHKTLVATQQRLIITATAVPTAGCLLALWHFDASIYVALLFVYIQSLILFYCLYITNTKLHDRFKMLTNIVEGISQGDYSMRIRQEIIDPTLNQLAEKLNNLAIDLAKQKISNLETSSLLKKVVDHIPVGVLTLDTQGKIDLINPAALQIFEPKTPYHQNELGFSFNRSKPTRTLLELRVRHKRQKYYLQTDQFINDGKKHTLILLIDVDHVLRAEERKSWENLIRVISHEINNSLTPVASISETLIASCNQTSSTQDPSTWVEPLLVIHERAKSLVGFVQQIKQFNNLQQPVLQPVPIKNILQPAMALFPNASFNLEGDLNFAASVDAHQMQLVFINLIKNAVEATVSAVDASRPQIEVKVSLWESIKIEIVDHGVGISATQNLFVPFYTTKPNGSGIGLALSRQIVEAHNGTLELLNNAGQRGCTACVVLPRLPAKSG